MDGSRKEHSTVRECVDIEADADADELQWFLSGIPNDLQFDAISYGGGFPPVGEFEERLAIASPILNEEGERFYWRQIAEKQDIQIPDSHALMSEGFTGLDYTILDQGLLVDSSGMGLALSPEGNLLAEQWRIIRDTLEIEDDCSVYSIDVAWHVVQEGRRQDWRAVFERRRVSDLDESELPLILWAEDRRWFLSSQWDSWATLLCVSRDDSRRIFSEPQLEVL